MSMEMIAILIFTFTVVERLIEMRISKKNALWSFERGGVEFGGDHYKWMVTMHSAIFVCILAEYFVFHPAFPGALIKSAMILAVVCQILRWWIISTLGRRWNTRVIVVPNLPLVKNGIYRFVKHPNYIVVAIELVALPMVFGAWRTAIVFTLFNSLLMSVRLKIENEALKVV